MKLNILWVILLLVGCSDKSEVSSRYPDGKPEIVKHYDHISDKTSYQKECYYNSGKLSYTGQIRENIKEGVWTWWYENGNKKDLCKFKNGVEVDTIFHWYENGNPMRTDVIKSGEADSNATCTVCCNISSTLYYENGRINKTFTYGNSLLQGDQKEWYPDGKLKSINFFKDNIENGLAEDYYSNGQIKFRSVFKDGCQEGEAIEWDSLGNVTGRSLWKDKRIIKSN